MTQPACSPAHDDLRLVVFRDSAGVTIVENRGHPVEEGRQWRLDEPPATVIGDKPADPFHQLYQVSGVLLLRTRALVIANRGTSELRFFDRYDGACVRTVGGQGKGPEEFRWISWVSRLGADSVIVWDEMLERGTVFSAEGVYARNIVLTTKTDLPFLMLDDATMIAKPGFYFDHRRLIGDGIEGARRLPVPFLRYSTSGMFLDSLGVHPGDELWIEFVDHPHIFHRAFGAVTVVASGGPYLWVGAGTSFDFEAFDSTGTLVKRVTFGPNALRSVPESAVHSWIADALAAHSTRMATHLADYYANMSPPATVPPYDRMIADDAGNLWLESYRMPGEAHHTWNVFDPDGRNIGSLHVPGGFTIHDVRQNHVAGVWRDSLDVEQVHVYRLLKPST